MTTLAVLVSENFSKTLRFYDQYIKKSIFNKLTLLIRFAVISNMTFLQIMVC